MGFGTEDPKMHANINVYSSVQNYGREIIIHRGSVPTYGVVTVRGVDLDIDALTENDRDMEVERDFLVD
jgi:hypothetical protein